MKILVLSVLLFVGGCSLEKQSPEKELANPNAQSNSSDQAGARSSDKRRRDSFDRERLVGCWSSGNGKVLRITDSDIWVSTNSFEPVPYLDRALEGNQLTFQLPARPQFYFFQEFLTLEIDDQGNEGFSLTIKDYRTLQDLEGGKESGTSSWARDDCKKWFEGDEG